MQASAHQRLGGHIQTGDRVDSHFSALDYVNDVGELKSPSASRVYHKPLDGSTNGLVKTRTRKRRRRPAVKRAGSMFGNLETIPTDVTRDPPPRACFNCWQQGHSRRECPRPITARYCNNCGRRGEDLRSCPRCSRAHSEYLVRLRARERGEEVEPEEAVDETLLGGEYEHDDTCDEVLRELIYQDDRARELRRSSYSQNSQGPAAATSTASSTAVSDFHEQRRNEQSSFRDRVTDEEEYIQRENMYNNHYVRRPSVDEENQSNGRLRERAGREYQDYYSQRDREYRSAYHNESGERKDAFYYGGRQGGERSRSRSRSRSHSRSRSRSPYMCEARSSRSENRNDAPVRHQVSNTMDELDLDADPVQEVLQLAKSIAHLTPETQDLIMRQVMDERKERIRLRAIKLQERRTDHWH